MNSQYLLKILPFNDHWSRMNMFRSVPHTYNFNMTLDKSTPSSMINFYGAWQPLVYMVSFN